MLRHEKALDSCLDRLEARYRELHPEIDWSVRDEIESIASASSSFPASSVTPKRVSFSGHVVHERKAEKLRSKVMTLEQENQKLKQQLQQMEKLLAKESQSKENEKDENREEKKEEIHKGLDVRGVPMTEGGIWNLVRSR
jgi:valyl-tRNA synthetase